MNVNGVREKGFLEQVKGTAKGNGHIKTFESEFEGRFGQKALSNNTFQEQKMQDGNYGVAGVEHYQSMMSSRAIQNADKLVNSAIEACEVRKITYSQCDYVKLCPELGAVYKAQVCGDNKVYLEEKKEDGTVAAYMVDLEKVPEDSKTFMENIAKEAWDRAESGSLKDTEEAFREAMDKFSVYAEERIEEGPPKFAIGASEFSIEDWEKMMKSVDRQIEAIKEEGKEHTAEKEEEIEQKRIEKLIGTRESVEEKGPYSFLMGEGPELVYNGVVFTYDQSGALCLGDMSNPDDCLTIYLTNGVFKLNRNNMDDLSKAISMFSPEDINRILRAISQDAKCQKKLKEIEDTMSRIPVSEE